MKKLTFIILFLFNFNSYGQDFDLYNSYEPIDGIENFNNQTKINLFEVDFNGLKIPIALTYLHNGVKINETQNCTGLKWKLEDLGYIHHTINYIHDNITKGWFNTTDPDFNSNEWFYLNDNIFNQGNPAGKYENDLSPDFFSAKLFNSNSFDFFFKKNIQNGIFGTPIPEFLSNPNGYKINANFLYLNQSLEGMDNRIVFNIQDKHGNNLNFINGPSLAYNQNSNGATTNNYYLKSITNPNTSDFVIIDYILTNNTIIEERYAQGLNSSHTQFGTLIPSNGAIRNMGYENFSIDHSKYDIQKISTNEIEVYFDYSADNKYLEEININDLNGTYMAGYKFEYIEIVPTVKMLFQIKKYNLNKQDTQIVYEFEYYGGDDFFNLSELDLVTQQYKDYLGYYNGLTKSSPFPKPTRNYNPLGNSTTNPAGNFEQNVIFAKQHSLLRIKNRYSGIKEFDYQLNNEFKDFGYQVNSGENPSWGNLYGGGIILSSVKDFPIIGKSKLTTYNYENLLGHCLITEPGFFELHYSKGLIEPNYSNTGQLAFNRSFSYYSTIPTTNNFDNETDNLTLLPTIHESGNFFKTITESTYDLSTMSLECTITKEYITNSEGIRKNPVIKSETYKNSFGSIVKQIDYNYSFQNLQTINSAVFNVESRPLTELADSNYYQINDVLHGLIRYFYQKRNRPIFVNRVNLIDIKEETFSNTGTIINNSSFTYINNNSKLLRSKTKVSTLGDTVEEKYYYPTDSQVATEPLVADLITKNLIGIPLKTETFRGTEKIAEQKTVYANDATTSNLLLPKYIYAKKGTDANSTLEKQITYDKYDSFGNLLQYTQENGVSVSMIWGYNNTKVIAKIENKTYTTITPTSLITNAQNASNINNNEANLLLALNAIRTNATFANALVTTFTYKSLIGISTVTDVKGDKISYTYDTYNRLESVKDKNGNILSENQYNYIPQN